jgi:hypothetical protein
MTNIEDIMIKSALEAVSCMNSVFSALDKIVDQQHNVYKVNPHISDKNVHSLFCVCVVDAGGDNRKCLHGRRRGTDKMRVACQRYIFGYVHMWS